MNQPANDWAERILELGLVVQRQVHQQVCTADSLEQLAASTGERSGDRIYAIDRIAEDLVLAEISQWPSECFPLLLIAEGIGEHGRSFFESPRHSEECPLARRPPSKYRLIVDPIDGTRMLMSDKRSAWFLAAVAEDHGEETSLSQTLASVMVELPPSKQSLADCFWATRGGGTHGFRVDLGCSPETAERRTIDVRPSQNGTLRDGFISVVSFFPGTKVLAAELTERIALLDLQAGLAPNIFEDQYISTGGQLAQLMTGRDRCVLDLRPLWSQSTRCNGPVMTAHPYDLAGLLVAQEAGVIVTDGLGRSLDAPLDVTTAVHWCGYANETIRLLIEPVVRAAMTELT